MLEGIDTLNLRFEQMLKVQELSQGAQLVGRTAEYVTDDGTAQGVVESARLFNGELVLGIDGQFVSLNDILGIVQPTS
jgi:flagellar basal-body rod modification protein FlgD